MIEKFVADKINDQIFSQYLPEIEKEIALIKEQIANLSGIMIFDLSNLLSYALKLSNNLGHTHHQGTFQTRQSVQTDLSGAGSIGSGKDGLSNY